MSVYYPQAAMILRVIWEDFDLKSDAALQKVYTLPIVARRLNVHINDYNTADTFDAEIDYKQFPFDPRCIRSCGVSIYLEDKKRIYNEDGSLSVIEPSANNVLFMGFADEETITLDEDKRTVKIEGRDFTSLLLDAKYLEGKPIPMGSPLDEVITQLLSTLKSVQKLQIDNRTGKSLPTLAQFAPDFGQLGSSKNTGKDDNYWEIIQDLVSRAGLICFIELDKLVISTPRVLYNKGNSKQFVYGVNVKSLEMKRKLGRHKGFNVLVRCLDIASKRVLLAKIPEEATDGWAKSTGVPKKRVQVPVIKPDGTLDTPKDGPFISFRVTNVRDQAKLVEIGEKIFEEMSRQQIEGTMETHEMETIDKVGASFNLTKIRVATPIAIELDQGDMHGISRIKSVEERERFLRARGYEPSVARAFASSMGKFSTVFYTKAATFTLDADRGFSLKLEFLNFIELDGKGINLG
jgi:hypothetical protein